MDEVRETMNPEAPAQEVTDPTLSPEGGAPPAAEAPDSPRRDEWSTVRRLALKHLNRFMALEPKVLRGDNPDAIHDMRVASRRLQQTLDLLYPKPRPREVRALRRKIQRTRRCLSEVRNCDVLLERVDNALGAKRASRREARLAFRHYLSHRRAESFEKALAKLGKVNLAVFYLDLRRHLDLNPLPPAHPAHPQSPAEEFTPALFYRRLAEALSRVWEAFESQLALSRRDPRPAVIHGARIATKRLRYLIEIIAACGVSDSEPNLAWLRHLQRRLGEWHDLEVLEQMMIEMVARPDFLREHLETAMGVEKLMARNRVAKRKLQDNYLDMTLDRPEAQRLKEWVGYLLASPSAAFPTA